MLPCCIFGALVLVQFMAFSRWFKRKVLRRPIEETEQHYWTPEKVPLKQRMKAVLAGRGRARVAALAVLGEVVIFAVVFAFGGFDFITHLFSQHGH
jgi:hypothetical protein